MARFDWGTRLVLKGLESYVDDNGVGKDDIALIAADVFPRDLSGNPHETLRQLAEAVQRLTAAGLVVRYEADGEELIYIDRWKDWQYIQHPKAGRFPRPDGTMEYKDDVDPASYMKPHEDCMTGVGEQGNRGTEEKELVAQPESADPPPPTPNHAAQKRGQRIPDDWRPKPETRQWAESKYGHLDLRLELEKFTNHWTAESGQKARKLDWDAAFRNWLHNCRGPTRNGHNPPIATSDLRVAQVQALKSQPSRSQPELKS